MSPYQSRSDRSEVQWRKLDRSGSSSQQRSFAGGGGTAPPPSGTTAALSANRSFKKSGNGYGGQSRTGPTSLNSQSNVAAAAATHATRNGAHVQPQLHGAPMLGAGKPVDSPVPRSSRVLPKAPSSQSSSGASDSPTPGTPSKGNVSRSPLQFGTISPGFVNGMQIPARTTSAPPDLDEQKGDQVHQDFSKARPTLPVPSAPKLQKKDVVSSNQRTIVESHRPSQAKRDAQFQISAPPVSTIAQKSIAAPVTGISMHISYQQPQMPLQIGGPGSQIQSQGVTASSLQMAMPLPVGNTTQVQQQVYAPGLQSHPMQPQGMMHQGQSLGFAAQMGHQLGNVGIGIAPQFTQQVGNFGGSRRAVKITHPETHEELKLDKRTDMHSDVGSSGPRAHPNVPPQSQPIQTFSPAHPINYFNYSPFQPNSYNPHMVFQSPTSVPLTSTQMNLNSSATRYNYPLGQGGPHVSFMNPPKLNSLPVRKGGPPMHGVTDLANIDHDRDGYVVTPASSGSVQVTVKPAVTPLVEKAVTTVTVGSSISKGESPKLLRHSGEASVFNQHMDSEVSLDSCVNQLKSVPNSSISLPLPVTAKHSTHTSVSLHGLTPSTTSVPTTPVEESTAVVDITEGQRREPVRRSNSLKDQQRKPSKKELQLTQQLHQEGSSDSEGNLDLDLSKLPGDNIFTDINAGQVSKSPENVLAPLKEVEELTDTLCVPSTLDCNVSSSEAGVQAISSSSLSSGILLESAAEASQDVHAGSCNASTMLDNGVLNGKGDPCEPSISVSIEAHGHTSKEMDVLLMKQDVFAMMNIGLKQETMVKEEHRNTRRLHGSLQDCSCSEVCTGSNVSESAEGEKRTVAVPHGTISDNVEEMNVVGESSCAETELKDMKAVVDCSSEVGRTVDNLINSFSISSGSIDAITATSHISPTNPPEDETSSSTGSKTVSEKITPSEEVVMTGSGIRNLETASYPHLAVSEMTHKQEGRGTESTIGGQTSTSLLVSKGKTSMDQSRGTSTTGRKKKMRETLMKADAAGVTADLYLAYKGPEEKNETFITSESRDASADDVKNADMDGTERGTVAVEDDGKNKSELDDWEDVEIPTPKLKTSENRDLVNGAGTTKHDGECGDKVMSKKRYSRDFLLTFSKRCTDLPLGFEIISDAVDILNSAPHDSHKNSGRIIDRPTGGSRFERHGGGIVDDDKWGKAPGSFALGRDPRMDVTHGGMAINFQPGQAQAGSYGVLRNARGQSSGQHIGGLLSAPMQPLASPGGLVRSSVDVERWQRVAGIQKGLIPAPQSPLLVMHRAERRYEVGKVSDEEEAKQRQLKGILNKLTPQNFEKLFEQVKEVNIDSANTLIGVISQIFDKALMEPTFCEMYADFCCHLAGALPDFFEDNKKITFKILLLNKCQEEFEKGEREQAEANRLEEEGEIKQSNEEREEKKVQARRRMLGNIRLIGELYKKKMLTERIMHECIKKLLGQHQNPDEEDIEALCKLMSTIGKRIDHPKAKEHMDAYFDMMLKLSNNHKLSSRVRFMLKDAIDLRKNKWQQRRKVEGPKKIEEVHRDAAQERQLQTSRLSRGGPGISSMKRGQPIDYGPRGHTALYSSLNTQQMSGLRSLPPQVRGYGTQDIRFEDRQSFESRMLSVPLPQRPIDDDPITLGPQGGLARGMAIKGQPLMPSAPVHDVSPMTGEPRRMTSGPNGYSSASDWVPNSRENLLQRCRPERFTAAPTYDKSNSIERGTSFENRDLGNVDHTFDRPKATSLSTGLGSSSGVDNVPMESKFSEDHLQNMSISAIREYYSARSEDEIRLCIKELKSPSFYPNMVMLWVTDSFERKNDIDRDLLAKLLVNLCKSQDGLLSEGQLTKGFEAVLSTLEDAVTDSPKAAEYLGRILGKLVSENVVPLGEIGRIIHDGGDEPGNLIETGLASDVLVSILESIKRDRGDSILKEMQMRSKLRLENFRSPDSSKSRLDAFI